MAVLNYRDLKAHVGHKICVVEYGDGESISVECEDCNEVILSFDKPTKTLKSAIGGTEDEMVKFFDKFYADTNADCGCLTVDQALWFFELIGFDVYLSSDGFWTVKDRQGGNLGGIEDEEFTTIQEFVNRAWDTYADSYFKGGYYNN